MFENVRPKARAAALIDARQHPQVHAYAALSAQESRAVSAEREQLWINGYQAYGDAFEKSLSSPQKSRRKPQAAETTEIANALFERLPSSWMLVGIDIENTDPELQKFWKLCLSRKAYGLTRKDIGHTWLTRGFPPERYTEVFLWVHEGLHSKPLRTAGWEATLRWQVDRRPYADILRLFDSGISLSQAKHIGIARTLELIEQGIAPEYMDTLG